MTNKVSTEVEAMLTHLSKLPYDLLKLCSSGRLIINSSVFIALGAAPLIIGIGFGYFDRPFLILLWMIFGSLAISVLAFVVTVISDKALQIKIYDLALKRASTRRFSSAYMQEIMLLKEFPGIDPETLCKIIQNSYLGAWYE